MVFILTSALWASEAVEGFKKDMTTFKQEMTVKLDNLEKEITMLKEKTQVKGRETKQKTVTELEATRDKVRAELNDIEKSSESNWIKIKNKIAKSIDKLNAKTQKLLKE